LSVSSAAPSAVSTVETTPAISRTNVILLVVLLLQLAVSVYTFWPKSATTGAGQPLLAGITTDAITGVTITDDSDRSVSFVKEGDAWTLANSDGYPANGDKIKQTLDKLVAIATDRLVTQTPASQGRLQVAEDNYLRKVDLTTASGVQTLYLGSSTGAASTHVRAATEDATYLTNQVATWELDTLTTTWIDVTYFTVPKEQINEVTLENANGTFTFVRTDNAPNSATTGATDSAATSEGWTLADAAAGEPIASANISTLIDRLVRLNLHSVLGKSESPDYGLATPLATLTVTSSEPTTGTTTAETKTTTFVIGAKDEENKAYYFKSSDSDFYVRLAAFTGDEFVNKQRSDFMVQAETPAEGVAPQSGPVAGPSPEATAPAVGNTDVPTGTSEIEEAATVTSSVTATDTSTVEPTAEPTVDASDTATDTTESSDADVKATKTPTSTATPTN
jgi:hypothetical protein